LSLLKNKTTLNIDIFLVYIYWTETETPKRML
jgi:hypothetical protein